MSAGDLHDSIELIERGCAREDWLALEQLGQDAAETPHINALRVIVGTEEDLGRSVPPSGDVIR